MNIQNAQLRDYILKCKEMEVVKPGPETADVFFLFAALDRFGFECKHSHLFGETESNSDPIVEEIIKLLESDELRPQIIKWYKSHADAEMNQSAIKFKRKLEALTGQKFS